MAQPIVTIVEQPAEKSFRFRYESEGRLSGSILGANSTKEFSSYPKIKIDNYTGDIAIFVSCVTNDKFPKQHPHKLSSKNDVESGGVYTTRTFVQQSKVLEFKDIGIVFVKKQNIAASLQERKARNVDPTAGGWDHKDKPQLFDLHSVRLCFQVLKIQNTQLNGGKTKYSLVKLAHVISNPVMDKKSNSPLKIVEMSSATSSVMGGERVIMLCDKVKREDISIVFYEKDDEGNVSWRKEINHKTEAASFRVHHQHAISFVTPIYTEFDIRETRSVQIQLYRPSDQETSESLIFEYVPNEQSIQLRRKKQKKISGKVEDPLQKYTNDSPKTEVKAEKPKYASNIRSDRVLIEINRSLKKSNDKTVVKEKENVSIQSKNAQHPYQSADVATNIFDYQYGQFAANTSRPTEYPQYYYTPEYQHQQYMHQNVNNHHGEQNTYNARSVLTPTPYNNHAQQTNMQHYQNDWTNGYGMKQMLIPIDPVAIHSQNYNMPLNYNDGNILHPMNSEQHANSAVRPSPNSDIYTGKYSAEILNEVLNMADECDENTVDEITTSMEQLRANYNE